jgi:hypothetical protein
MDLNIPEYIRIAKVGITMLNETTKTTISAIAELTVQDKGRVKLKLTSIMDGETAIEDMEETRKISSILAAPAYEPENLQQLRDILGGTK